MSDLSNFQKERQKNGDKVTLILWTTTPVETKPPGQCVANCSPENFGCGFVPYRCNDEIKRYNEIIIKLMHEQEQSGVSLSLFDSHGVLTDLCGEGYTECPKYQFSYNVHLTSVGSQELSKKLEELLTSM